MAFILDREREEAGAGVRYRTCLERVRDRFPPGAWALATSEWYWSFADSRCPLIEATDVHFRWLPLYENPGSAPLREDGSAP